MLLDWFEVKVSYDKVLETGKEKRITEQYVVNAYSFTEAEANIVKALKEIIGEDFFVEDISRASFNEILFLENEDKGDRWYKNKINFISIDEKSGCEKKAAHYLLVRAFDFDKAKENLKEGMEGTLADYEIEAIKETKILDVFTV